MPSLLREPTKLRQRLEELLEQRRTRGSDPSASEALAEGSFRLALHPDTSVVESLGLLRRSVRLDGSNPKYAYHLARMYFLSGRLQLAADWLTHAYRLCPTSHRIWCHFSLLQRELNRLFKGNPKYEPDALRKRSDAIAGLIKAGEDQLDPALLDCQPPVRVQDERKDANQAHPVLEKTADGATATASLTPIRRFLRPQQCRWRGIDDLNFEHLLEANPSQRNQKKLHPLLAGKAAAAKSGAKASTRFAVLAIEWLICGYPVATVRRLMQEYSLGPNTPSLQLLDLVCTFYEAELATLPVLLSEALAGRCLPPLLAALVHQRRLLWRPLEFRQARSYRQARRFLAEAAQTSITDEESRRDQAAKAEEHVSHLQRALQLLNIEQPKPLSDFVEIASRSLDHATAWERFLHLEKAASALSAFKDETFKFLKDELSPTAENTADDTEFSRARADFKTVNEIIEILERAGETGNRLLTDLAEAVTSQGSDHVPENFIQRREECSKHLIALKAFGNFRRRLSKVEVRLKALGEHFQELIQPPSADLSRLLGEIQTIHREISQEITDDLIAPEAEADLLVKTSEDMLSTQGMPATTETPMMNPGADKDVDREFFGLAALQVALKDVDIAIAKMFADALATFTPYAPGDRCQPALRELRTAIQARQAETVFRLGHYRQACRLWNSMLGEDRLAAAVLKNIAVCDTRGPELGDCLTSWSSYVEMLYFFDLVASTPRPYARIRADFHRSFGNAYAPAFLNKKLDKDWDRSIDDLALLSFCASPGRVRNFVDHKILEFINAKLDFTSPPLLLGVSRAEGEGSRTQACEIMNAFLEEMASLLPARVRIAFVGLVKRHLENALKACSSAVRLTVRKDPHYAEELPRQEDMLKEFCQLKVKLVRAVQQNRELGRHLTSVAFLQELGRLDRIPLGLSEEMLLPIALSFGMEKTETLENLIKDNLCRQVIRSLLDFIFSPATSPEDETLHLRQYRCLVNQWVHHPALEDFRDLIDDPQPFYPVEIERAFSNEVPDPEAVEILYGWQRRYPELTGPTRLLAILLNRENKFNDAVVVLDQAIAQGFHAEKVVTCHYLRMVAWYYSAAAALEQKNEKERGYSLKQAFADAKLVIEKSRDPKEQEHAREIKKQIQSHLP